MKRRVVIIDDSEFIIGQLSLFFEQQLGYSVVAVGSDGIEAVDLYRQHKPDLLTLDITMPNMDGQQTIQEIIAEFPTAKILMISAVSGSGMLECINAGAADFIEKPLRLNDQSFVNDFKRLIEKVVG
ncbi:MAG: response regulator [Chitinivibrionales bacterium]|nr:response regulator [Chitinivibrionales bacterium]